MRTFFIAGVLLLPAAAAVNSVVHGTLLMKYAKQTLYFRTGRDILRLKEVVARQMYAAVLQMVLLILPLILYLVGLFTGALYPTDLPLIIVPAGLILVFGYFFKKVEIAVRNIPALNQNIEQQRDEIVRTWKKKPPPDW